MKRILSFALSALMLASMLCGAVGAAQYNPEVLDEDNLALTQDFKIDQTFVIGDVNSDGTANAMDSYSLKLTFAGNTAEGFVTEAADFDGDGTITSMDSYAMKLCLGGAKPFSDYENGKQLYNLTIGGISIKDFSIVIPADAVYDSNNYYATELLFEYIKKTTGVSLPIVRDSVEGNGIYVYQIADDSELGEELGHEGYKYYVENGNLYIYGTHRGCMYAAYEIIENYLGVSFASKDYTFVYKQRSVDIPEDTDVTYIPAYRFRHTKSTFPAGKNREMGYLARRLNGTQSYNYKNEKRSLEYYGDFVGPVFNNIHSYSYYWAMGTGTMPDDDGTMTLEERYFAKYQSGELHDETTWEPCATDADEYAILFSGFLDTIRMIEARGYPIKYQDKTNCYSFSINDNSIWCQCRKCVVQIREKTGTGLYLELASKGARDIQEYYPGLDVLSWTYTREMPKNVVPDEHLVIVLAGFNCANHYLGSDECVRGTFFGFPNSDFEDRIDQWDDICEETGAEIWLWYYPESHYFWFVDIPNFYTIYHDVKWASEHGISGFFYEGSGGKGYLFENAKAYLASLVMFNPDMTLEEYDEKLKDYLYECYGRGWENIYTLIQMYEEAGDAVGFEGGNQNSTYCYIGNYDRAYDLVSIVYMQENYETMRNLLLAAIEENDTSVTTNSHYTTTKLNNLFYAFEILGLGATYLDNYVNGTDEQRAEYTKRADAFLEYYLNTGMTVSSYAEYHAMVPEQFDYEAGNPAYFFFPGGSRRLVVIDMLGKDPTEE